MIPVLSKKNERVFLRFGKSILDKRDAHGVLFKHALQYYSVAELADAVIVLSYNRIVSNFIQTFDIRVDPQENGN